ncbi:MAG: hypothetical protein J0L59_00915 [Xanthomonadales bacterium]|nr:hypothetical protein [Xanthomonadales bacterium]
MSKSKIALAVLLASLLSSASAFAADGTFINVPDRKDMVHDAKRGLIYITSSGTVQRYDIASGTFLAPLQLGGGLLGLDLSPDGNTLVVADAAYDETTGWVHLVSLNTLQSSKSVFPRPPMEAGTYTAVYGADGNVYTTSAFLGSGWVDLRKLDTSQGIWSTVASVRQNTMLSASGDGQTIAFAEANISDGRWGLVDIPTGQVVYRQLYQNGTSWFNFEIATDQWGSQFAIPTYGGTMVYNDAYSKVATLGAYAGAQPIGVAYHPVEQKAFFPWATTSQVRVYDMGSLTETGSYDFGATFDHTGNGSFVEGRTKLSRDGSILMASVDGGVRFVQMYAPLAAAPVSVTAQAGQATPVALSGSIGNGGQLTYSIIQGPSHGQVSLNGSTATYTAEAGYSGNDAFTYRVSYGRASRDAVVSVMVFAPQSSTTCASEGYVGTQLTWCRNICEKGYTGATLDTWIRRWLGRYRELPYCLAD